MKKIISILTLAALCLAVMLSATSCAIIENADKLNGDTLSEIFKDPLDFLSDPDAFFMHPIDKVRATINETNNYKFLWSMSFSTSVNGGHSTETNLIPLLGFACSGNTFCRDGELTGDLFKDSYYVVNDDAGSYCCWYDSELETWVKGAVGEGKADELLDKSEECISQFCLDDILKSEKYEPVDGEENTYKLKDGEVFDESGTIGSGIVMENVDVICVLEEGKCTFTISAKDGTNRVVIEIFDIGSTEITLPEGCVDYKDI